MAAAIKCDRCFKVENRDHAMKGAMQPGWGHMELRHSTLGTVVKDLCRDCYTAVKNALAPPPVEA